MEFRGSSFEFHFLSRVRYSTCTLRKRAGKRHVPFHGLHRLSFAQLGVPHKVSNRGRKSRRRNSRNRWRCPRNWGSSASGFSCRREFHPIFGAKLEVVARSSMDQLRLVPIRIPSSVSAIKSSGFRFLAGCSHSSCGLRNSIPAFRPHRTTRPLQADRGSGFTRAAGTHKQTVLDDRRALRGTPSSS